MTNEMWGANLDMLERFSVELERSNQTLTDLWRVVRVRLQAAPWEGPNADQFRALWEGPYRRQLEAAAAAFRTGSQVIARNVAAQRQTSAAIAPVVQRSGDVWRAATTPALGWQISPVDYLDDVGEVIVGLLSIMVKEGFANGAAAVLLAARSVLDAIEGGADQYFRDADGNYDFEDRVTRAIGAGYFSGALALAGGVAVLGTLAVVGAPVAVAAIVSVGIGLAAEYFMNNVYIDGRSLDDWVEETGAACFQAIGDRLEVAGGMAFDAVNSALESAADVASAADDVLEGAADAAGRLVDGVFSW